MACPIVVVTPGMPGTAPAIWGNNITLATTDLVGFGAVQANSEVSLKCSDGRTLVNALSIVSWSPQTIVCTLPARDTVAACDDPLFHELSLSLLGGSPCGYAIDIIDTIDPTQPGSIDPNDLTELAKGFSISVSVPGPGPLQTGVPVRVQLVPPLGTGLSFAGIDGLPLPVPLSWKPPMGAFRLQAMEIAALSRRGHLPPLVVRSAATYAAFNGRLAASGHGKSSGAAAAGPNPSGRAVHRGRGKAGNAGLTLPTSPPAVTVSVQWTVTAVSLFGAVPVEQDTLFALANPDDPLNGIAPTLESVVLGILFRPWVTAQTNPPRLPLQVADYVITAQIRLSVGGVTGDPVNLQTVKLPVPTLEIPVVLLLFRDSSFSGRVLPCLPANSLFNSLGPLRAALQTVQAALAPLKSLASVAAWLLGLDTLLGKLPVDDNTTVAIAGVDGKINLDDYELDHSISGIFGNWDWEDQVSSILLFGPPAGMTIGTGGGPVGSTVEFFSAPSWSDNEGQYNIDIGFELSVLVFSLSSKNPDSLPAGALTVVRETTDDDFNDRLSTLRFL